jgi:hypothetical protein
MMAQMLYVRGCKGIVVEAPQKIAKLVVEGCVDCVVRLRGGLTTRMADLLRCDGCCVVLEDGADGDPRGGDDPGPSGLSLVTCKACTACEVRVASAEAAPARVLGEGCDGVFVAVGPTGAARGGGVVSVDEAEQGCETQRCQVVAPADPGNCAAAEGEAPKRRVSRKASGAGGRLAYTTADAVEECGGYVQ